MTPQSWGLLVLVALVGFVAYMLWGRQGEALADVEVDLDVAPELPPIFDEGTTPGGAFEDGLGAIEDALGI